jgi:hypothetical protein
MQRIMFRSAEDDYCAMITANAMESAGAGVFAITPHGTSTHDGALAPHQRFQVWAKVESDDKIAAVDAAIEREMNEC